MKTSELAEWLGLAAVTVRQWSQGEYRQYLSPAAQGGSGRTRNFTDIDQRVIAHVARLKANGMSRDELHAALKSLQSDDWRKLPEMPAPPPNFEPIAMIPTSTADTALQQRTTALMREIATLQEWIERLESELSGEREKGAALQSELTAAREQLGELRGALGMIETERRPASWWLGVVAGVALAVVILAALVVLLVVGKG